MIKTNIIFKILIAQFSVLFLFSSTNYIAAQNIEEKPFAYSEELQEAAEKGETDAMYKMGLCYYVGKKGTSSLITSEIPIDQNHEKALLYLSKAANKGSALAMLNLGKIYSSGHGAPKGKDLKLALKWYHKAAEKGCADAYANIAKAYETEYLSLIQLKIEKIKDPETALFTYWDKAVEYNKLAAEKGSSTGAYNIAFAYLSGSLGLAIDYSEANKWFRRSMELGNKTAINFVAQNYLLGLGVAQNKRFGLELMKQAAIAGEPLALNNFGSCYYSGSHPLPLDKEKALLFLVKANALGYDNTHLLNLCYAEGLNEAKNYATPNDWLEAMKKQYNKIQLPEIEIPAAQTVYKVEAGDVVNDCGSWSIINSEGICVTDRRYDLITQDPASGELKAWLHGQSTKLNSDGSETIPILEPLVNSIEGESNPQLIMTKSLQLLQADANNQMGYNSIAYYNYAVFMRNTNNFHMAKIYLKKALEVNPDLTAAKEDLMLLDEEAKAAKKAAKKAKRALIWKCITTGFLAASEVVGQIAANKQANANSKVSITEAKRQKNKERIKQLKEQGKEARQNMHKMINRRAISNAYTEGVGQLTDLKNNGQYGSQLFRDIQQHNKSIAEKYGLPHHESENW